MDRTAADGPVRAWYYSVGDSMIGGDRLDVRKHNIAPSNLVTFCTSPRYRNVSRFSCIRSAMKPQTQRSGTAVDPVPIMSVCLTGVTNLGCPFGAIAL